MNSFWNELKKDFVVWYVLIGMIVFPTLILISYNDPAFTFNQNGKGLSILVLGLFPIIWMMIYLFCKYVEYKNRIIAELQQKLNQPEDDKK